MTTRIKSETAQIKNAGFVMFLLQPGRPQSVILDWIDVSEQVSFHHGTDVHQLRKNGDMP